MTIEHIVALRKKLAKAATHSALDEKRSGALTKSVSKLTRMDSDENLGVIQNTAHMADTAMTAANAVATAHANVLEWRIQRLAKEAAAYEQEASTLGKSILKELQNGNFQSKYVTSLKNKKQLAEAGKKAKLDAKNRILKKYDGAKVRAEKVKKVTDKIKSPKKR